MLSERLRILKESLAKQPRLFLAGGAAALLVAGWLLYVPPLGAIRKASREYLSLKAEVEEARRVIAPLREGGLFILPTNDEIPSLLEDLNDVARSRQIQLLEVSPQPARPGGGEGFVLLPVELRLEGGYRLIGEFLGALRATASLGVVGIQRLSIDREERILPRLRARVSLEFLLSGAVDGS